MIRSPRRRALPLLIVAALLIAACGGNAASSEPAPTNTVASPAASASAEPTAAAPSAATPTAPPAAASGSSDVDQVVAHIDALSGDIGSRAAGTEAERAAATYIAGVLEAAGYDTTIEPFAVSTSVDGSTLSAAGEDLSVRPFIMNGSASASASGPLVYGALGAPEDLAGLAVEGRVLLLDRGVLTFAAKVRNAELAGAVAVVIANNEAGIYSGSLGDRPATVPLVAISRDEGRCSGPSLIRARRRPSVPRSTRSRASPRTSSAAAASSAASTSAATTTRCRSAPVRTTTPRAPR